MPNALPRRILRSVIVGCFCSMIYFYAWQYQRDDSVSSEMMHHPISVESKKHSKTVPSANLLLGIILDSDHGDEGSFEQRRHVLKATYLRYYQEIPDTDYCGTDNPICSLLDSTFLDCRIRYVFVIPNKEMAYHHNNPSLRNRTNLLVDSSSPVSSSSSSSSSSSMTIHKDTLFVKVHPLASLERTRIALHLAWLRYVTNTQSTTTTTTTKATAKTFRTIREEQLIGVVEATAVLQPPIILDAIDRRMFPSSITTATSASTSITATTSTTNKQRDRNSILFYGSTPFVNQEQCFLNVTFRKQHTMACHQPTGRFYIVSLPLARHVVSSFSLQPLSPQESSLSSLSSRSTSHHQLQQQQQQTKDSISDVEDAIRTMAMNYSQTIHFIDIPRQPKITNCETYQHEWSRFITTIQETRSKLNQHKTSSASSSSCRWNEIFFVTAKFGRRPQTFAPQVTTRRNTLLLHYGVPTDQLVTYDTFPDYIIQDPRWESHLQFTTNDSLSAKGGGYWFWKAPIVQYHLKRLPPSDQAVLVYADVDLSEHMMWIESLVHTMRVENLTLALYQTTKLMRQWTKPSVYQAMCSKHPDYDPRQDQSVQFAAGFLVLRRTPGVLHLMEEWSKAMSRLDWLVDDEEESPTTTSTTTTYTTRTATTSVSHTTHPSDDFREHRHDQSLLSCLIQCALPLKTKSSLYRKPFHRNVTSDDRFVQMFRLY